MLFVGLGLLAVGVAFLVHAGHAADGERILLDGARLVVASEIRMALRQAWCGNLGACMVMAAVGFVSRVKIG